MAFSFYNNAICRTFAAMSQRIFPAVSTFTWQGKVLVAVIRFLGLFLRLFYRSHRPVPNFEENPAHYSAKDILYFAYKYYLKPPEKAETDSLQNYFHNMNFSFPKLAEGSPEIQLSSGGDLMPYHWLNEENTQHLWDEIGPWYFNADIVFANLETPIDIHQKTGMVPEVMLNDMHFNGDENLFKLFNGSGKFKGFDILSTANNHSLDMGIQGLHHTLNFLDQQGIKHTGTARSAEEQKEIRVIEAKGMRIAFVAATYCLNHLSVPEEHPYCVNAGRFNLPNADVSPIRHLVEDARSQADFVVLSLHNGNAYQAYPSQHTMDNVHRIFETCGPDLILGSHPHNPQPIEQYNYTCPYTGKVKNSIAVYSQGDFVAYDIFTWCHLHLGIKFTLGRDTAGTVCISAMEVMPQFLWHGDKHQGFDFRFLPLKKALEAEKSMSKRSKKELAEIDRFWKSHLAPSLSIYEAP